jgi:flagellar basal body-associated protein FliL
MEVQMIKKDKKKSVKKGLLWVALVLGLILAAATGYAVLPSISLNSPTSFPVDI